MLTSNSSWCAYMQAQSQNIMDRYYCVMPAGATALAPITQAACVRSLGTWTRWPNWGLPAPPCIQHATSRDNHLGNDQVEMFAGQPQPVTANYVWTIPASLRGQRFVVRFRYNISATTTDAYADFNSPPGKMTNSALNCQRGAVGANGGGQCSNDLSQTGGPVALYNNPYVLLWNAAQENDGMQHRYLALAVNTAQVGRTFQDRSYVMEVRQDMPKCTGQVINLNVRGKRGNIVQAYRTSLDRMRRASPTLTWVRQRRSSTTGCRTTSRRRSRTASTCSGRDRISTRRAWQARVPTRPTGTTWSSSRRRARTRRRPTTRT